MVLAGRLIVLCGFFYSFAPVVLEAGGGWLKGKGRGFVKLSQSVLRARYYFTPEGKQIPITTTSFYASTLYAEYGIANGVQGMIYMPFFSRFTLNRLVSTATNEEVGAGDDLNAIGDTDIGLKVGLLQRTKIKVAVSLILGLPVGESSGGKTKLLQTGDGEFNQFFLLEASTSLYPLPVFFSAGTGLNVRSNNFSEEFRYYIQGGVHFREVLYFICQLSGTESFYNGDPRGVANSIFSNNTEYLSLEPSLLLNVHDHVGLSASVALALSGRQVLAAPQYSAGIYANW